MIYIGGGTPKNFIQQAEVGGYIFQRELPGHKYAVQITMDQPQWGGLSGCTFEEAQSWRKIAPDADDRDGERRGDGGAAADRQRAGGEQRGGHQEAPPAGHQLRGHAGRLAMGRGAR